ncbi:hypothetical protein [Haladaptatus sp. NG-WS-4]
MLHIDDTVPETKPTGDDEFVANTERTGDTIQYALESAELELIGPNNLRARSRRSCESAYGKAC